MEVRIEERICGILKKKRRRGEVKITENTEREVGKRKKKTQGAGREKKM